MTLKLSSKTETFWVAGAFWAQGLSGAGALLAQELSDTGVFWCRCFIGSRTFWHPRQFLLKLFWNARQFLLLLFFAKIFLILYFLDFLIFWNRWKKLAKKLIKESFVVSNVNNDSCYENAVKIGLLWRKFLEKIKKLLKTWFFLPKNRVFNQKSCRLKTINFNYD